MLQAILGVGGKSGLGKFLLDFAFNIGGLRSKHPLFFIGAQ